MTTFVTENKNNILTTKGSRRDFPPGFFSFYNFKNLLN